MKNSPLPRLDVNPELCEMLAPYCRLDSGALWTDPVGKHKVGCLDATECLDVEKLMGRERAVLAIQDPPYNLVAFEQRCLDEFIAWCTSWVHNTVRALTDNSSLYVWLGADQNNNFQPLPDFMIMMRGTQLRSKSFITMRNQRGYGTQQNWMAVRQELLYYIKGKPTFNIEAEYTDIPKILRGYYKKVGTEITENIERGHSENIRAGNVWVDIQQVFYRMEENVNGCYAQKPLKSCERIIQASSAENDIVLDFFCHSGSTLLASELTGRRCYTIDTNPIYCEIAIRRLENLRQKGKKGWQHGNPFEQEINRNEKLSRYIQQLCQRRPEEGEEHNIEKQAEIQLKFL